MELLYVLPLSFWTGLVAENQEHDDRMHVVIREIYPGIVVSPAVVILDRPRGRKSRTFVFIDNIIENSVVVYTRKKNIDKENFLIVKDS